MPILHNSLVPATGKEDPVTRSLRFDTNGKLSRTFGTPNSKKTFTLAFWVKRAGFSSSAYNEIWQYNRGGRGGGMGFAPTQSNWMDEEEFQFSSRNANTGVADVNIALTTRFRDPAAWMHIALVVDTTLGSSEAADRIKIFVNNERQTNYDTSHTHSYYWPAENYEFSEIFGGTGAPQNIGLRDTNNHPLNGYLADIYFIDGAAIEPDTNFIESTGYSSYKPLAFDMSSYSGNSFHIDAQPAHDADLLVSSIDRNDGDTLFADAAKGHTITRYGNTHHDNTVGNPFGSGTAMYFDGSGDYLQTSTSSDLTFGTGDFTLETWLYPTTVNTSAVYKGIISDELYSSTGGWAVSQRDDELSLWIKNTGGSWVSFVADGALTANQWQHIAVSYDSSTTTTRLFVDGTSVASGTTSGWNLTGDQIEIGRSVSGQEVSGYLFDVRATKGEALYTSNFTAPTAPLELNPVYIGGDQSGNKNHFTPTNISTTDIREDNPFKNHATWNPLIKRSSTSNIFTYSEGNTVATYTGGVAHTSTTIASSGVHYAEFAFSGGTSSISGAGVVRARWNDGHADSYTTNYGGCYYGSSGNVDSPSGSTSVSAVGSNRLGIAFDGANNKADFYSVTSGGTMTLLKSLTSSDSIDFDGSATFTATSHDTGATSITGYFEEGEWYGTAPSVGGTTSTALNASNLSTPAVTPEENFLPATYTGAGGSEEINLGFTPNLTWIKRRVDSGYWHGLYDSVRGLSAGALASNSTNPEDSTQRVASFDSDTGSEGFTLSSTHYSYTNTSGKGYVSWNWKAHEGGPVTRSHTMTLEVNDLWGTNAWGSTKLEVWEGATKLSDISQPAYNGGSSTTYTIKTNNTNKIKVVWDVDSSMDWTAMYAVLKDSSNNTLADWDGYSYYEGATPADGSNFYIPSSHDSSNAAETGVVESSSPAVESYNSAAGFTMIKYAGDGSYDGDTKTLDHSLGVPLEFVIAKARTSNAGYDNGDWIVWHKDLVSSKYLFLNENYAQRTEASGYNLISTTNSGTQHQVVVNNGTDGSSWNYHYLNSGEDYILYGWAGVEGYSKFGKYEGNNNTDGPFIYCGFRPKWIMTKRIDGASSWAIIDAARDPNNDTDKTLASELSLGESSFNANADFDILSNGFKIRHTTSNGYSNAADTHIFAVFAEQPFSAPSNSR